MVNYRGISHAKGATKLILHRTTRMEVIRVEKKINQKYRIEFYRWNHRYREDRVLNIFKISKFVRSNEREKRNTNDRGSTEKNRDSEIGDCTFYDRRSSQPKEKQFSFPRVTPVSAYPVESSKKVSFELRFTRVRPYVENFRETFPSG